MCVGPACITAGAACGRRACARTRGIVTLTYLDSHKTLIDAKRRKNGRPRRARPPRLTAAAPTRHICHPKNEKQKGNYPLVALHHRFLRKTEATIESKFMICNQAGAARGTRAGGGLWDALRRAAKSKEMRVRGAAGAARVVQGSVDGMHGCMARLRRACRCAARGFGHARGREALGGGHYVPPRQRGASSRRRIVEAPTLVAAAKPPDTCRTSRPPQKCEHRVEFHLDKV